MSNLLSIYIISCLIGTSFCSGVHAHEQLSDSNYQHAWSKLENFTRFFISDLTDQYKRELNFVLEAPDISDGCRQSLDNFFKGLKSMDLNSVRSKFLNFFFQNLTVFTFMRDLYALLLFTFYKSARLLGSNSFRSSRWIMD